MMFYNVMMQKAFMLNDGSQHSEIYQISTEVMRLIYMIILKSNNTALPFAYKIPLLNVQGIHTNI